MADTLFRNAVGAKNPYAIAELKLRRKINWGKKTQKSKIRILEEVFGRPYGELFDPRFSSPLFPKKTDKKFSRIASGAGDNTACAPNPCPVIEDWLPVPNGKITPDTESYDDLIQGCLPDCYFIAAVSAVAWATMTQKDFRSRINTSPLTYTFWSPQKDADGNILTNKMPVKDPPVSVDETIPVLKPDIKIYSRSYTANETWPCILEKAYAHWQFCKRMNLKPTDTTIHPDYIYICQGNPITVLMQLQGKIPTYFYTTGMKGSDIYNIIGTQNPAPPANPAVKYLTNYPAVAWTHNPLDKTDIIPAGVFYRDDVLVANHSYTVLGVFPSNGKKYIVLRNPWGQKCGDPKRTCDPATDPFQCKGILPDTAFAKGKWLGKALEEASDGIFGLDADVFQQYFAGFGWVC